MSTRTGTVTGRSAVALVAMLIGALITGRPILAASAREQKRPSAMTELAELNGAMPRSFDVYPADPCSGLWNVEFPSGEKAMDILVMRYRNVPLAHLEWPDREPVNSAIIRLNPHSIRITASKAATLVLRCVGTGAVLELTSAGGGRSVILKARPGQPASPLPPAAATSPTRRSVRVRRGNIQYVDAGGGVHPLTDDGNYSEPILSPDGHTVAFIHLDGSPTREGESGFTSLWVADALTGTTRRLLTPRSNDEPSLNLASFQHPRFSLDGGFIYIDAEAWTTSAAVHQVSVATGKERFVVDGSTNAIIRTGKYRGYLLVGQHKYYPAPRSGSYDPVYVVRPDAKEMFMVPGSDKDDGEHSQAEWLQSNGWTAW